MIELPEGPTKYVHVNPAAIARNTKTPDNEKQPVCVVKCDGETRHCFRAEIHGPSSVEYEPGRNQGATVRIHTAARMTLHNRWPCEGS